MNRKELNQALKELGSIEIVTVEQIDLSQLKYVLCLNDDIENFEVIERSLEAYFEDKGILEYGDEPYDLANLLTKRQKEDLYYTYLKDKGFFVERIKEMLREDISKLDWLEFSEIFEDGFLEFGKIVYNFIMSDLKLVKKYEKLKKANEEARREEEKQIADNEIAQMKQFAAKHGFELRRDQYHLKG